MLLVGMIIGGVIGAALAVLVLEACQGESEVDANSAEAERVRLQRRCWALRKPWSARHETQRGEPEL